MSMDELGQLDEPQNCSTTEAKGVGACLRRSRHAQVVVQRWIVFPARPGVDAAACGTVCVCND